ncbi:TetR/AcrR family transcriptional regulator [Streptococcus equinus]|uniref:TetR/AcrR family transcriptional regulator n=1 Tax=Streptococcus equinus TaxID=1335 RepID=UPI0005F8490C|nr:TetR/AcrR family transcriptional regulator [Streptococcus equinus]
MVNGTRDNIINAFFKLASKYPGKTNFTIAEIAEEAQLSKQAIYKNHFNNADEILQYLHKAIDSEVMESFVCYNNKENKPDPLEYFAISVIPIIYKRRNWLRLLYSTTADPKWRFFLKQKYTDWLMDNIAINSYKELGLPKESIVQHIINCILSIIEIWITQEVPDHPQKFSKIFLKLVKNYSISDFIKK